VLYFQSDQKYILMVTSEIEATIGVPLEQLNDEQFGKRGETLPINAEFQRRIKAL